MDGEVGRSQIASYDVLVGGTTIRTRDLFPPLHGKEQYLTNGLLELALLEGTVQRWYRKTSALGNRIRRQVDAGTPGRTLRDVSEKAGTKVVASWTSTSEQVLAENGFSSDGTSVTDGFRSCLLRRRSVGVGAVHPMRTAPGSTAGDAEMRVRVDGRLQGRLLHRSRGTKAPLDATLFAQVDFYRRDVPAPADCNAKVVPLNTERRRFAETRIEGFRLRDAA